MEQFLQHFSLFIYDNFIRHGEAKNSPSQKEHTALYFFFSLLFTVFKHLNTNLEILTNGT